MMRYLVGIILAGFLAWCLWWWVASAGQRTAWQHLLDTQRAEGRTAEAQVTVKGFPNRIDTTLMDVSFADPTSGWGWDGPYFQTLMLSYKPNHVIAAWPPTQQVATPLGDLSIETERLMASAVFVPNTDLGLDRFNVEGTYIVMGGLVEAALPRLLANARRLSAERPERYELVLEITDAQIAGPRGAQIALDRIRGRGTLALTAPVDRHAAVTPPAFDWIGLESLRFERGSDTVEVTGALGVDRDGFLDGTLTATLSSPGLLSEILETGGIMRKLDPLVGFALRQLGAADGELPVAVELTGGSVFIGPLRTRIGAAPRLR